MTDLKLVLDSYGRADLVLEDGDLVVDESLKPAALLSLFTDRLAMPSDNLPDGSADRRGYWADAFGATGDRHGSRLWLIDRAKLTADVLARTQEYALEALGWLTEDNVAGGIEVRAQAVAPSARVLTVRISRLDGTPEEFTMELPT